MKTLMAFTVRVTTPFVVDNAKQIRDDYSETLQDTIERCVKDELESLGIVGLAVEVKERK